MRPDQPVRNWTVYVQRFRGLSMLEKMMLTTVLGCYRSRAPCRLSISKWSALCSCSRRSIFRALLKLEGGHYLKVQRVAGAISEYQPAPRIVVALKWERR